MLSSSNGTTLTKQQLNQAVWRAFTKSHGFTLQADAADYLIDRITSTNIPDNELGNALDYIAKNYSSLSKNRSSLVDRANLESVMNQLFKTGSNSDSFSSGSGPLSIRNVDVRKYINIVDAFETPKFEYNTHAKAFQRIEAGLVRGIGEAEDKIAVYQRRYNTIKQRLMKQLRTLKLESSNNNVNVSTTITPIKSMRGSKNPLQSRLLFGVLSEQSEKVFHLEDDEDSIELNLSRVVGAMNDRFYVEGAMVLVKGKCQNNPGIGKDKFIVDEISMVQAELRKETLTLLTHPDVSVNVTYVEPPHVLKKMEMRLTDAFMVFMSQVWLDQAKIIEKIEKLLATYAQMQMYPVCIVLMGPFSASLASFKEGPRAWQHYQDLFDGLAEVVLKYPSVSRRTKFVFVPDEKDTGFPSGLLPRRALPSMIFDSWRRSGLDFISASNPCRLIYFTREILVTSMDLTSKLLNSAVQSEEGTEMDGSMNKNEATQVTAIKTVLDQSTLTPWTLTKQPCLWNFDHSLSLYPLPDVLVIGERQAAAEFDYQGCKCLSPGTLPAADAPFIIYHPSTGEAEVSLLQA